MIIDNLFNRKPTIVEGYDEEDLANQVYAEFEMIYPNLARRADQRTIHAAIVDVLNYGGDSNPSALAQDVARAVKRDMQQGIAEGLSKRDQKDVDAIRAAIERLQAQLDRPNADQDAIQQSITHEKKRLALYKQGVAEGLDPTTDSARDARGNHRGEVKKTKDGSYVATNQAGSRKIFTSEKAAKAHANSGKEGVAESRSAVAAAQDVTEGYWADAVKKAEADREARKGKPFEKNPASHDKNGVYIGDKDLAGKPVPKRKEKGVREGVVEGNDGYDAESTRDEYMNLQSGDYVRDTQDSSGEVFIMRGQPDDRRVRIEDKDGRGWNIAPYRLVAVDPDDAAIGHYFNLEEVKKFRTAYGWAGGSNEPRSAHAKEVAANRKEYDKRLGNFEPADQMFGVAKLIKDIAMSDASPEHKKVAIDALNKQGVAEGSRNDDEYGPAARDAWLQQQAYEKEYNKKPVVSAGAKIKIPTEDGITMQDIRLMAGEGKLTKKTVLQAIAVIRKQRRQQGMTEGSVDQLPTRGADYSNYDTDHLKIMLRPGVLHRNEARFKALIRKELHKREQQSDAQDQTKEKIQEIQRTPGDKEGLSTKSQNYGKETLSKIKMLPGSQRFGYTAGEAGRAGSFLTGADYIIELFDVKHPDDGLRKAGFLSLRSVPWFPIKNSYQVANVGLDNEYRGTGLGQNLYGVAMKLLGMTIVADETQTPQARSSWLRLSQVPGVSINGFTSVFSDEWALRNNRREIYDDSAARLIGLLLKAGGQEIGKKSDFVYVSFPVGANADQNELQSIQKGISIYSARHPEDGGPQHGLYARWGGPVREQGVAEGSLEELANTSLKVKEPKDFVNTNDRKQVTYKVMKFKSGKDTYLINFTVKGAPAFGKKQNWNAVNVSFGVREEQDDYSFGDEINTDLTAKNKNQFLIYSTVINAVRKFITEYNTEIDEIIMQGAGERQEAIYQRFFQSAGKYFPGWHHDGKHSLVRDVPRHTGKKVKEQGVAEGNDGYDDESTRDEYMNLQSGDYVRDSQDSSGEVFIMRGQPDDRRVRIEDKDGRGWNIAPYRLIAVDPEDAAIGHYFNDINEASAHAKQVAAKRKEYDKRLGNFEPTDDMVGTAKMIKDIAMSTASPEHKKAAIDALNKKGVAEGSRRKKKKTSRSLGRYFFPGYGYYGSGEPGGSGDGGGGESINRDMAEGKPREKEADYGADYQDMVSRVKKLAGMGPLKTVYDPVKRVYKNVPQAEQPKKPNTGSNTMSESRVKRQALIAQMLNGQ